ncbi:MAG: biotin transporter BioY, partial [Microbacteriaceae bacterium]
LVFAAAVVGWLAQRRWDRRWGRSVLTVVAGTAVVYAFGLPWLYFSLARLGPAAWNVELGFDSVLAATIGTGLLPFLIGDAVKALLAVLLIAAAWRLVRTLSEEPPG